MIQVTVSRDPDGLVRGIECRGHAGFAPQGQDIICSAVSALALNMANSVEAFTEDPFEGQAEEDGRFSFHFTGDISAGSKLLMDSLVLGLQDIREAYGKEYINIRSQEV